MLVCFGKVSNLLKSKIEQLSSDIKAFTVKSTDYDLSQFTPGEYITVDVSSEKIPYRAKRHYSIVSEKRALNICC